MESPTQHKISVACLSHWWNHVVSANPNVIWDLLRHTVQHQMLNNEAIALPFLSDLRFYKLHAGVVKRLSSTAKRVVLGEPVQYQPAGELSKLIVEMSEICKTKLSNVARNTAANISQHWHAALSDKRGGETKGTIFKLISNQTTRPMLLRAAVTEIELIISGCELEKAAKFESDDLRVNIELLSEIAGDKEAPPQALYIVNERYLATLYLSTTIGQQTKQFVYENFPVGIVLFKYKLESDGKVEFAKEIRGENFTGEWKRITQTPQPEEQLGEAPVGEEPSAPSPKRKKAQSPRTPDLRLLFSPKKSKTPKQ
ncbi:hypothetical protein TTRE_0000895901 [Trichuris trichiura]|uniref:Uncharacterized protein n=1 Tax=Trichuris trichiura TaxID=36087 RepID=A0A077ZJJ2_TRITR|nr:hypothetical protein TTRE_0000895901 [Trichuris trichiura]